ncbi:hypothetical protein Ae406Ps2_0547c [Pseudonocardia sp. Ae406_Ps2]|nr:MULTISPECIES: carboxymuconolactone decarboxylase family protein [unclassified Pseudonocardia]OLM00547.1 hypothetical protein Ae406Ps2_0547c [Pseudonocardia sp. Ae406_Ps2]OLM07662.1 hypothetical protein Ae331Ps2_5372 [Pseudonocardia sp. Ae331_Ps2]OLM22119.1 hypothetical protein Ae706Ps2_0551c [Pseudonocardia sp. Ae706_Ps2]
MSTGTEAGTGTGPMVGLLPDADLPEGLAPLFEAVRAEYGFVPNILRALAHCPDLTSAFVPLWAEVYRSPTIGPRLRALAALGTATTQECTYCIAHMSASARRAGIGEMQIGAIGDAIAVAEVFDDGEALVLEVADALTRDPDGVTEDLRARLRARFSEAEIVNIVLAVGMYNLTSRFLKALEIGVEDVFGSSPPTPQSTAQEDTR